MLNPASGFRGLSIAAMDGDIGSIRDLYFDDITWTIRYLVVDTGNWLPGRQVLISPLSVRGERLAGKVAVNLSREQVENSPPIDADKPVDRQQEEALARYYNQQYYWKVRIAGVYWLIPGCRRCRRSWLARIEGPRWSPSGRHQGGARKRSRPGVRAGVRNPALRASRPAEVLGAGNPVRNPPRSVEVGFCPCRATWPPRGSSC